MEKENNPVLITIDVEDWFQVENLRSACPISRWDEFELRVEKNLNNILEIFQDISPSIRATFFILGWVAERFPGMVRKIRDYGHEIASHGYGHCLCTDLSPLQLEEDLKKSKQILEEIIGEEVVGYRAPNFSVSRKVLEKIKDTGYTYDSSYNSFGLNPRYGKLYHGVSRGGIFILNGCPIEIPISNLFVGKRCLPWGGGGYFRFYPFPLFMWGVKRILRSQGYYLFYFHPWEMDPSQPRIKGLRWDHGIRHYLNLEKTAKRLKFFIGKLRNSNFITCREWALSFSPKN